MLALYAELDDKAAALRQALELKSRFLSYMSHEFRTPLTSITSLTNILLSRMDGPLTTEQTRQVEFMRGSVLELTEMVNDLLDLAKVEAGRITISPEWFEMVDLFSALRGIFKPIVASTRGVAAVRGTQVDPAASIPTTRNCRRSCATTSPTRSNSPAKAKCAWCAQLIAEGMVEFCGDRHRHRHRRRNTCRRCSPILSRSTRDCSGVCAAPGWGCRWRENSPNCWADE